MEKLCLYIVASLWKFYKGLGFYTIAVFALFTLALTYNTIAVNGSSVWSTGGAGLVIRHLLCF